MLHGQYKTDKDEFQHANRRRKGLFPGVNAMTAQYLMKMWELVKKEEGVDHKDWYDAGIRIVEWVMKQGNEDGSLPQVLDLDGSKKAPANPGRSLVAFPELYRITGDKRFLDFAAKLGRWTKKNVEDKFYFTGYHVDRGPDHYETHSIWANIEYLLDIYEETQDPKVLARAEGCAYLNLTWRCPKQLPWVDNPTESATDEQMSWQLYTIYCYDNRMMESLHRLHEHTGNDLWRKLYDRLLQLQFWSTVSSGKDMGNMYTGLASPWNPRGEGGYNWQEGGKTYHAQYALDLYLQLMDLGVTPNRQPEKDARK
jgi:hypothetical protein